MDEGGYVVFYSLLVMLVLLLSVWAILPQNSLKSPEDDAEVPESKEV